MINLGKMSKLTRRKYYIYTLIFTAFYLGSYSTHNFNIIGELVDIAIIPIGATLVWLFITLPDRTDLNPPDKDTLKIIELYLQLGSMEKTGKQIGLNTNTIRRNVINFIQYHYNKNI